MRDTEEYAARSEFTLEDVQYYLEERPDTDGIRLLITYKTLKEAAENNNKIVKGRGIETDLNIMRLAEKSGLSQVVSRKKLEELKDLGIAPYEVVFSNKKKIYFNPNNGNCEYLDKKLKEAQIQGLLKNF